MSFENQTVMNRPKDRRREDRDHQQPRERRRPPAQSKAAAQSIVMAHLAETPKKKSNVAQAAHLYSQAVGPKPNAAQERQAEQWREAELAKREVQKGWTFERRKKQIPRSTTIEDAEIL